MDKEKHLSEMFKSVSLEKVWVILQEHGIDEAIEILLL